MRCVSVKKSYNMKAKGFGATIEQITTVIGIKRVVDTIAAKTGKDCGCNKRKEALNDILPY